MDILKPQPCCLRRRFALRTAGWLLLALAAAVLFCAIVAGQKVQGRSIVIRKERLGEDLRHCHVLFISASERQHSAQILAGLHEASVLTVSDMDGFADAGGVMQFVMQENRVHFVVNLDTATQSKLRVSAKLLALARVINHGQAAR